MYSTEKPTAVVVDDELPMVELVCEVLRDEGMVAIACPYGRNAHRCVLDHQPEVVILDVQMPGVDGIEVFRRLRDDAATQAIPVIFFTANARRLAERLPNFREMGAELLPKPFDVARLLDLVDQVIGGKDNRS